MLTCRALQTLSDPEGGMWDLPPASLAESVGQLAKQSRSGRRLELRWSVSQMT